MKILSQISRPLIQWGIIPLAFAAYLPCVQAQTAPPPKLGEETKGEPVLLEQAAAQTPSAVKADANKAPEIAKDKAPKSFADNLLGKAIITESRRESGQVYRIELEHSSGSKQIIEENDSDGRLSTKDVGLEDAPNLTKWKLGSW